MKNNDVTQGLAIGIAFAGLVSLFPAQANAEMTGKELCDGSIKYAIKYMPEDDAFELHKARWQILDGDNTSDNEKLIGLVMFEIGQRVSYSMTEELNPQNTEWWNDILDGMESSCQAGLDSMGQEDLSEMESEGSIW